MKNKYLALAVLLCCILVLPGCLTCDIVTYVFTMTSGKSGTVKIYYNNIQSTECSEEDFVHFFDTIVNGNGIAEAWPEVSNIRKNFFEKNGKLDAEVTMDFNTLDAIGLYQYHENGPLMFMFWTAPFIGMNGKYVESNGTYGGERMPVVFWDPSQKMLTLKIQIPDSLPVSDMQEPANCLLEKFREKK